MPKPACSDEEFIKLYESLGPSGTAKHLGIDTRATMSRRRRIEDRHDTAIASGVPHPGAVVYSPDYPKRTPLTVKDGVVVVGSDPHYWPGDPTPSHRGFCHLIKELKPKAVILNGDVADGARLSRFPPIRWNRTPTWKEELAAIEERTDEIRSAAKGADLLWALGNHDMRFENMLVQRVPDMEGVRGAALKDHFPHWQMVLSIWINGDTVVKHRFKGGIHATHNNALWSGKTIVTGHLHSLKVTPFDDYNGTRWGVDTGTLSDPYGPHTEYTEDNPLNHRSGFVVLTFAGGKLLWPEIVSVWDKNSVVFRGQIIRV